MICKWDSPFIWISYFIIILLILQRYNEDKKLYLPLNWAPSCKAGRKPYSDPSFATSPTIIHLEHGIRAHYCCDYRLKNYIYFWFQYQKNPQNNYLLQSALLFIVNKTNIQFSSITFLTYLKFHYLRMPIHF